MGRYAVQGARFDGATGLSTAAGRRLRPGSAVAVGLVGLAAGLALLVPAVLADPRPWPVIGSVLFGLVLLWLFVVRPSAVIAEEGVRFVNPLRTVDITWSAVTEVRSRWTLQIATAEGRYTAWGIPADPKRPRHGHRLLTLGADRVLATSRAPQEPARRPKVEAQTVAVEIEARVAAERQRSGDRGPIVVRQAWDRAAVALLVAGAGSFVVTVFFVR